MREVYLDNNATTRPLPEVREAMMRVLDEDFGNPSSAHSAGDRVRESMVASREAVANLVGAEAGQIVFMGSGTETNNTVFNSVVQRAPTGKRVRIVTTTVEHSSILKMCDYLDAKGVEVVSVPVDRYGQLVWEALDEAVTPDTDLVSVQWVNNETGAILLVERIAQLCKSRGVLFHTDAAQAVGKLPISVIELPVDFLTFTAHKFHGPQGVGALYVRSSKELLPLLWGGSQEGGLRPGTENVPGIIGMGTAAQLRLERLEDVQELMASLRDHFERTVLDSVPDVEINGDPDMRVCNTTNLLFRDVDGQALVARLDQEGIRCSQSSACTNQRPEPSYVLRAMGLSEAEAYASIRFSFSEFNTIEDVDETVAHLAQLCEQLRRFSRRRLSLLAEVG
ncbi:MAG: cysteine desulfurase family protein [Gemmatimonadetes bacterium]|nr:cysteine desulfurase family protein [Gemmatimonadota bacterium]